MSWIIEASWGARRARELAIEISLTSLGSSQIFRLPHFRTDDARRFCSSSDTPIFAEDLVHGDEEEKPRAI